MAILLDVLRKAKGLLVVMIGLFALNLGLFLWAGLDDDIALNIVKYIAFTFAGFAFVKILLKKQTSAEKGLKFWALYRVLSLITLLEDLAIGQGFLVTRAWVVMVISQVLVFLVYLRVLQVYDRILEQGDDFLLTEEIREWVDGFERKNVFTKFISQLLLWIICSFWYGSDILVLIRRKGNQTTAKDIWTILLPSSILGTAGIASIIGGIVVLIRGFL